MGGVQAGSPRVASVVLNFNGLEDTVKCLRSLMPLAADGCDVILVDNGSAIDPAGPALDVLPDLTYLRNTQNLGYAGGNNTGIRWALERGADFVLVLNNDTVVAPSIVDDLLAVFAADDRLGIVGPVVNFMDEPDVVMTDGVAFNPGPGTEFFKRIIVPPVSEHPSAVPVDIVNGCCMMIRSDVFHRAGLFDEQFFIVHEESDLCLRAGRAGFGCAVLSRTLVWHKGSSAFERSGRQLQRYFDARNLFYLIRRHTGKAGGSRNFAATLPHYLKYCFYRYDGELEARKPAAARAVVEGAIDAFAGRVGPYARHRRPAASLLSTAFSARRRLRGSTPSPSST